MRKQLLRLTPAEVSVLARCPLHYHFLQVGLGRAALPPESPAELAERRLDEVVRESIQQLHAAGGPARLPLEQYLKGVEKYPRARPMLERYYERLKREWPQVIAGNEEMELRISIAGVALLLTGTVDRLDKMADGGVMAVLFRTGAGSPPGAADLRQDYRITAYHVLVAATYPQRRPVTIQELWLQSDQSVEIELSETEYRRNLAFLREPIQALARGEVTARPGLHCDSCPFKYYGCPVYAYEAAPPGEEQVDEPEPPPGKILQRKWVFNIYE